MTARNVVAIAVGIVLATTLASGPLVGLVDLTGERSFASGDLGEGRATVGDLSLPDDARFERGDFGSGSYYLRVGSATADVREVIGRPILSYELSVPAHGFTTSTIVVLTPAEEGRVELALDETAFGRSEITEERYDGRLSVDVRSGGTERVLVRKNVTVEVTG